jgi:CDP-diacylglycerol--glycerol-3-phosphate 3-phosphatidyltransferase
LIALARHLPFGLTLLRALLAPVVLFFGFAGGSEAAFAACLIAAFLSDYFDGVIARRLGVATPGLRRMDSAADSLFYLACVAVAWHLHPGAICERWLELALLAALEVARYVFDLVKFRREASYHMWSSKFWGLCLLVGFYALLVHGHTGGLVSLAVYAGIVADLEGLVISVLLPHWQTDVPSFVHALRQRQAQPA